MKLYLTVAVFAGVCLSTSVGAVSADRFLIVPGRSIGRTALGPDGAAQLRRLPPPTEQDDGMSQERMVWVSRAHGRTDTLYLHLTQNGALDVRPLSGETIDTIRVTSSHFHTRDGISTASTLAQIRRRFPSVHPTFAETPMLYDAPRRGISFEFARPVTPASQCIGITVYKPAVSSPGVAEADVARLLGTAP